METKVKKQTKKSNLNSSKYILILHNDDKNTFEWVIACLISICDHEPEQANQCAFIVHYSGKCDVKHGDYDTISNMKMALEIRGLSVTIEENN